MYYPAFHHYVCVVRNLFTINTSHAVLCLRYCGPELVGFLKVAIAATFKYVVYLGVHSEFQQTTG
jgi:hypothetical protein